MKYQLIVYVLSLLLLFSCSNKNSLDIESVIEMHNQYDYNNLQKHYTNDYKELSGNYIDIDGKLELKNALEYYELLEYRTKLISIKRIDGKIETIEEINNIQNITLGLGKQKFKVIYNIKNNLITSTIVEHIKSSDSTNNLIKTLDFFDFCSKYNYKFNEKSDKKSGVIKLKALKMYSNKESEEI